MSDRAYIPEEPEGLFSKELVQKATRQGVRWLMCLFKGHKWCGYDGVQWCWRCGKGIRCGSS